MMMGVGGGQAALTIEQQALALIAALGGKKETADNIRAFSEARQEAEAKLEALLKAQADIALANTALEAREKVVADKESRLASAEQDLVERSQEQIRRSEQRNSVLDERTKQIGKERKTLNDEKKEFDKTSSAKQKELDEREEAIKTKEEEVQLNFTKAQAALADALLKNNQAEERLKRLVALAEGKES